MILDFEYDLIDARLCSDEYIRFFMQYCDELVKEDSSLKQYDFTELAKENLNTRQDHPYIVKALGESAGLVVFMDEDDKESVCKSYIGELYILPKYRRHGIGGKIAEKYLLSQKYDVGLCFIRGSFAEKFWKTRMSQLGYSYKISREDEVRDFMHIYIKR